MRKSVFLFFILFGCVNLESDILSSDQLTVEGVIEEDKFAEIFLTNSLPFAGIIDSLEVAKSMESKAKVELSNGEVSEILTLKRDDSRFPFLYYRSNLIKGEQGKVYDLSITIRNKTFTSKTTVPEKPEILAIDFLPSIVEGVNDPKYRDVKLTISNSASSFKYFKVLIKNEKEDHFELARPFIFNTENISTNTFPLIVRYVGLDDEGIVQNRLRVNEIIELKLIAITKEQYSFWKSVKGDQSSLIENAGFTSELVTNISNGAFGYWSGEHSVNVNFKILEN